MTGRHVFAGQSEPLSGRCAEEFKQAVLRLR